MLKTDIIIAVDNTIERKIGDEWKNEVVMLGCSSFYTNFEIDGKEYVLVCHEVKDGHDFSEYIGGVEL